MLCSTCYWNHGLTFLPPLRYCGDVVPQRSSQDSGRDILWEECWHLSCSHILMWVHPHSPILPCLFDTLFLVPACAATMLFPMIGMADSPPGSKNNRGGRQVHVRGLMVVTMCTWIHVDMYSRSSCSCSCCCSPFWLLLASSRAACLCASSLLASFSPPPPVSSSVLWPSPSPQTQLT